MTTHDPVNHPAHYTAHPSGIECLDVVRHLPYELGNVIKYCWRWKDKSSVEDLRKAQWYLKQCGDMTRHIIQTSKIYGENYELAYHVRREEPPNSPLSLALTVLRVMHLGSALQTVEALEVAGQAITKHIKEQETH